MMNWNRECTRINANDIRMEIKSMYFKMRNIFYPYVNLAVLAVPEFALIRLDSRFQKTLLPLTSEFRFID